jgi:hypothetical protein
MLKNINIGSHVKWLNKPWSGVIKEVQGFRALVILNDGFEEWEQISQLLHVAQANDLDNTEVYDSKNEEKHIEVRPLRTSEIDLHIENLFVHWQQIPKEKILERQLSAFKEEYQNCFRDKIDEFIVIHGKGSGVLKENLIQYLKQTNKTRFEDMTYGKYKQAAIKIYFNRPH